MDWILAPEPDLSGFENAGPDLPVAIRKLLMLRDIDTTEKARIFLGSPKGLTDPDLMPNLRPAVDRLLQACQNSENIVVFGGKHFGSVSANWYKTNEVENWQTPILKESDRQIFIDLADRSDSIREIVLSLGALFVDSQQLLCDGLPFCSNFVDGDLISYDGTHFTPFGAELFGSKLKAAGENTFLNSEK